MELRKSSGVIKQTYDNIYLHFTSFINRTRAFENLRMLMDFVGEKQRLSIADMMEYVYHMVETLGYSPHRTDRAWKYLRVLSPLMDDMPFFACAYLKCSHLLTNEEMEVVMDCMKTPEDKALAALALGGIPSYAYAIRYGIDRYNPETGVLNNFKLSPWSRKYMNDHVSRIENPSDDQMLFFSIRNDEIKPYVKRKFNNGLTKAKLKLGKDPKKHIWLSCQLGHVNPDHCMRYL
jgi:hypothetical protein